MSCMYIFTILTLNIYYTIYYVHIRMYTGLISKSTTAFKQENYADVVKYLIQIRDTDNNYINTRALLDLSTAYRHLKKYTDALEAAKRVIQIDGQNSDAYIRISEVYSDKEEYSEAIKQLQHADQVFQGGRVIHAYIYIFRISYIHTCISYIYCCITNTMVYMFDTVFIIDSVSLTSPYPLTYLC